MTERDSNPSHRTPIQKRKLPSGTLCGGLSIGMLFDIVDGTKRQGTAEASSTELYDSTANTDDDNNIKVTPDMITNPTDGGEISSTSTSVKSGCIMLGDLTVSPFRGSVNFSKGMIYREYDTYEEVIPGQAIEQYNSFEVDDKKLK